MKIKTVLKKNNCLIAIGEKPMEIIDDKWNEIDGNAISIYTWHLRMKYYAVWQRKRQQRKYGILSQNCRGQVAAQ